MGYQTVNPFNNEVVASFEDLTDEQAMELLGQAQKTFESWSQTSFPERTAVIKRSAAILRERSDEFARLLTLEMGKLYTEALGEGELSAQILDYYAEKSEQRPHRHRPQRWTPIPRWGERLWRQIEADLDAKTTLMVETGISWWDGVYTRLPGGARFEIEMQWGSIGWAVPAACGYSVGLEADRRLVAAIGDGSFQLTAQEVSNMIRHRQEILIFLVNNRGYVIESAIHDGPYNYYKNWDYAGLIDVFNAEDGHGLGLTATTPAELADAIATARAHTGGPVLIECQVPNEDASPEVISWGSKVARVNARPPQHI